ncbi:DUF1559 domain-containing protein [uncultured Gimesia sp.]|uniref:DUF1559 domain-containing protein n=1 Tax=uncultured Gimesia sp. TaxID=1678688 RepID=UPI0030D91ED8|tara:strand:+ start:201768 stop:202706 length:939 start_codon:yes stop_codon:yes gene_type:complete
MKTKKGFTLIELLVVIAIIAILIALLLPAVQQAREAARRTQCKNNLKQLGLALHNYYDVNKTFPPGWIYHSGGGLGQNAWGWGTFILPYMDQAPLYNNMAPGTNTMAAISAIDTTGTLLPMWRCPTDAQPKRVTSGGILLGTANYNGVMGRYDTALAGTSYSPNAGANAHPFANRPASDIRNYKGEGIFGPNSTTKNRDITDGTSNTLMVGEKSSLHGTNRLGIVWAGTRLDQCAHCSVASIFGIVGVTDVNINEDGGGDGYAEEKVFTSRHVGGAHFLLGDGAVRFLSENIDTTTFQNLGNKSDGNVIGEF